MGELFADMEKMDIQAALRLPLIGVPDIDHVAEQLHTYVVIRRSLMLYQGHQKERRAPAGLHKAASPKQMVLNSQVRDSSSKIIFDNHILCSQFLRDYVNLPYLKDVRPEDIEDVSEQYVTLFAEERNSDRVKRVHIGGPFRKPMQNF